MYYIHQEQDRTKTVALQFLRTELLNDLDQYGYVEGDVQRVGDPRNEAEEHLRHGRHQTQDITQDGNIDIVTRHLDLALARCRATPIRMITNRPSRIMRISSMFILPSFLWPGYAWRSNITSANRAPDVMSF